MHEVLETGLGRRTDDDGRYLVEVAEPDECHAAEREVGVAQLPETRVDRLEVRATRVRQLVHTQTSATRSRAAASDPPVTWHSGGSSESQEARTDILNLR